MFKLTKLLIYCLMLISRLNNSYAHSYAVQYPYRGQFEHSESGGHSSKNTDEDGGRNSFYKNQAQDKANNVQANEDVRKFSNNENLSKQHHLDLAKSGQTLDDKRHAIGEDYETDKSHNRKEIKTGFHTTYSKDEHGTNSSFYEDSDDHGGKLVYDKRHDAHGNVLDANFREGARDGHAQNKAEDQFGGFKSGGARDRHHFLAHDKGDHQRHRNRFNSGETGRYESQRGTPHYENNYGFDHGYDHVGHLGGDDRRSFGLRDPWNYRHRNLDYYDHSDNFANDLLDSSPSSLSPSSTLSSSSGNRRFPLNRNEDDGYYARRKITIYEDPRDFNEPHQSNIDQENAVEHRRESGFIYHSEPILEFVRPKQRSSTSMVRFDDNFVSGRGNWRRW